MAKDCSRAPEGSDDSSVALTLFATPPISIPSNTLRNSIINYQLRVASSSSSVHHERNRPKATTHIISRTQRLPYLPGNRLPHPEHASKTLPLVEANRPTGARLASLCRPPAFLATLCLPAGFLAQLIGSKARRIVGGPAQPFLAQVPELTKWGLFCLAHIFL
ncbi:hypothetical protein IF1G_00509 [Cordyceps javanica]|uniref:Uncharacterized protein n=1 Tax=Cordyceps javanica TaxID=43265 RepID=A0A545VFS1_9HYPO|nr:hypothetical protein IF1G_00509 [Cordyceps javanica]